MRGSRVVCLTLFVTVIASVAAPAAFASNGALSQLPGTASCLDDPTYQAVPITCQQAVGIGVIQSIAVSPDGKSLYTAAVGSDAVAAFTRDTGTGLLTQVPGGGGCIQDSSATPESGCAKGAALQIPDWVSVSPNGEDVYASSYQSQAIDVFSRDSTTGALTQLSGTAGCISSASLPACSGGTGVQGPGVIALTADGKYAYVALFGNNLANKGGVAIMSVGAGGALTQAGCLLDSTSSVPGCVTSADSSLRGVGSVAVSPDGNFVYVAARESGALTIYTRNPDGSLTRLSGADGCIEEAGTTPCASGTAGIGLEGPNSIAISPNGSHVYVASFVNAGENTTGTTVAVFARNSTTGALTQLPGKEGCFSSAGADPACATVPVLDGPFAVTTSPDGASVYVTDYGNNTVTDPNGNAVTVFSADSSGALTPLPGLSQCVSADGSGGACSQGIGLPLPHQTVISPDGNFAYVAGHQDSSIDIFATVPAATNPPSDSTPPSITGSTTPGQTLTADPGTWSGTQSGDTYQWEDCDTSGANCTSIPGASGYTLGATPETTSHTLTPADVGHTLRVVVTATNSAGLTSATSDHTATVEQPGLSNTALPTITGKAIEGQTLTASTGAWTGNPTGYVYQWNDCDSVGANCGPVAGATDSAYSPKAGDVGHTIRVTVTARNAAGSGAATSAATAIVVQAAGISESEQLVTCIIKLPVIRTAHHALVCKLRSINRAPKPESARRTALATLTRGGTRCAIGTSQALVHGHARLVLTALKRVVPGRYTLILRTRHVRGWAVRRLRITVS